MELKKSEIDKFLGEFKLKCVRFDVELDVVSSHRLGSHYLPLKIVLDRAQIESYIESSNADALQVWKVVAYHEWGHHLGYISEESCLDWVEQQSYLDQATVTCLRSQVTWGSQATPKGRNWHRVKTSLRTEIVQQFIKINQLSSVTKEALQIQTPGQAWYWVKRRYGQSLNLEEIVKPLLPNSRGYLMELCYSQQYDPLETEIAGLLLWREIASLL